MSSDSDYFHDLFVLLITWSITISFTRYYFFSGLILRIMHIHSEQKIDSDGAFIHALFGLLLAWSSTISCTRAYFRCKNKISSDGAYLHAFLGLLI